MQKYVLTFIELNHRHYIYSNDFRSLQIIGYNLSQNAEIIEIELRDNKGADAGKLLHTFGTK